MRITQFKAAVVDRTADTSTIAFKGTLILAGRDDISFIGEQVLSEGNHVPDTTVMFYPPTKLDSETFSLAVASRLDDKYRKLMVKEMERIMGG